MNQDVVVSLAMDAMAVAMKIAMPMLLVGLVVGLLVSVFQAVTQIQEQTLSFIPKVVGLVVVIVVAGPWMLGQLADWTRRQLWASIPQLVGRMNVNALLAQFSEQQVAGFMLVLAPHRAAVPARAAVLSSKMLPARARRASSRSASPSASRRSRTTPASTSRSTSWASAALVLKELLVGLAFAFALGRAVRRRQRRPARCSTR